MLARMVVRLEGQPLGEELGDQPSALARREAGSGCQAGLRAHESPALQADRHRLPVLEPRGSRRSGFRMPTSLVYRCGGSAGMVACATHRLPVHLTVGRESRERSAGSQASFRTRQVSIDSNKPDRHSSAANRLATVRHVKGVHQGVAARCFSTRVDLQDMRQIVKIINEQLAVAHGDEHS